jgi:3-hydroxyisobutyrate dehydrogenase-like beta-hydroxyacid dehydrogenase
MTAPTTTRTIGIASPGAMGSALGRAWASTGATVVTTLAGRSERTRRLAQGLTDLADLDSVVAASDVVVSVCPPAAAPRLLDDLLAAARRTGTQPVIADLNALSPMTVEELAARAGGAGIDLLDGAVSGPPPRPGGDTMLYLAGARADLLAVEADGLRTRVVGDRPGVASAVKMCTGSVYKGTTALWAQALQTADHYGVLEPVLDDLREEFPGTVARAARLVANATSKSGRFVAEMEQIAATQETAGASPELFEAMAAVYTRLSRTSLAELTPEESAAVEDLGEVLARLS